MNSMLQRRKWWLWYVKWVAQGHQFRNRWKEFLVAGWVLGWHGIFPARPLHDDFTFHWLPRDRMRLWPWSLILTLTQPSGRKTQEAGEVMEIKSVSFSPCLCSLWIHFRDFDSDDKIIYFYITLLHLAGTVWSIRNRSKKYSRVISYGHKTGT